MFGFILTLNEGLVISKSKRITIFTILEFVLFVSLFFVKIKSFYFSQMWFGVAVTLIGLFSFFYSYQYNLDSSFLYGVALILIGACVTFQHINLLSFRYFYPVYILCVSVAHFAVFVRFRQFIHFKIFTILFFEAILLVCYKVGYIGFNWLILINAIYAAAILINVLLRVRKNLRRNK